MKKFIKIICRIYGMGISFHENDSYYRKFETEGKTVMLNRNGEDINGNIIKGAYCEI